MEGWKLKADRMASQERLDALIMGKPIDHVCLFLFAQGFCAKNTGVSLKDFYSDPKKSLEARVWTAQMYGNSDTLNIGFASAAAWDFGGEVRVPSGDFDQAPVVVKFPVTSEDEISKLDVPDVQSANIPRLQMEFCRLQEEMRMLRTLGYTAPFTNAAAVCGLENLSKWMIKKPDLVHHLLRLVTDYEVSLVRFWVETFGAENIQFRTATPTSSNQVISPKQFREFSLPYLKEAHETILNMGVKYIFTHICGDQNLNLGDYMEVPFGDPGMLSFGHEVDLTRAIEVFGDSCIIVGNLDTRILQTGSPKDVYLLSKECIEKAKQAPKGFILGPGCELPPMAPACNVWAMRKAINDFGWYE